MTSAPRPTRLTTATTATTLAAALTLALTLTACSSDNDGDDATPTTSTSTAASGTDSPSPGTKPGKLDGSWLTTTDGKAVVLIVTGKQAALFATGGTVCSGTAAETSDTWTIHLPDCQGASDNDRGTGTVDSVTSKTLKVTWKGDAGTETYQKSDGTHLPSGFPTSGLPGS
ncbi:MULTISPECIES: hypothetical protein [unclassified Streptomyces]|uniref:hypothetical protein n=1 Tax=unclassified Streptomyces TaxID=2593676 RepID=UPI0004C05724|nr:MULTISPECIES: hypothetical protein [unclassified Streptomyces]